MSTIPQIPLRPLGKRVCVRQDIGAEKTEGGILVPDTARTKELTGIVVAVGDGVTNISKGDRLLFPRMAMEKEVELEGEKYLLMRADTVIAKFVA